MSKLDSVFRILECGALIAIAFAAVEGGLALKQVQKSSIAIQLIAEKLPNQLLSEEHVQFGQIDKDVNQFGQILAIMTDRQLTATRKGLLAQTQPVSNQAVSFLAQAGALTSPIGLTLSQAQDLITHADKVVSDPDIPKTVRSTRALIDESALTMSHVRSTANTVNEAMPSFVASDNKIAASIASISGDVAAITGDMRKPRPWYAKTFTYILDGVKLGSVVF